MVFNLSKSREDAIATVILNIIIRSILGYFSYIFLMVVVWLNFMPLLIVVTTIFAGLIESMLFIFAKFFAPIIIKFVDMPERIHYSSANGDNFPIMKIFFVMSLIFIVFCEIGKFILKKFFHKDLKLFFKNKAPFSVYLTNVIYFLFLVALIFGKNIERDGGFFPFVFVSAAFYGINLLALRCHLKLEKWIQKIDEHSFKKIKDTSSEVF